MVSNCLVFACSFSGFLSEENRVLFYLGDDRDDEDTFN